MKRKLVIAGIAAVLFSAAAWGQWGPGMGGYGYGMGPGMMGGYGHGYGYGMGPGMMGGYGHGYGYGMGPGMMGGDGPGYGGYCYGPYGAGTAKGGYGYEGLGLTAEQRGKIEAIEKDAWNKRWSTMKAMHDLRWSAFGADAKRDADPRKVFEAMADLRKQAFDASLDARKRIDAVLTDEQKAKLRERWQPGW